MESSDCFAVFRTKKFKKGQGPRFKRQTQLTCMDQYILDGHYDSGYALQRILNGASFKTEKELLKKYENFLPKFSPIEDFYIDVHARKLLFRLTGEDSTPMSVQGDGNCFFRSVSLAMFGNERHHCYVRLLTVLEIMEHAPCYDTSNKNAMLPELQSLFPIITHSDNMALHVAEIGQWASMLEMYATSAALNVSFSCCRPPVSKNDKYSGICSRLITGRNVPSKKSMFTILWSSTRSMRQMHDNNFFNHFVLLTVFDEVLHSDKDAADANRSSDNKLTNKDAPSYASDGSDDDEVREFMNESYDDNVTTDGNTNCGNSNSDAKLTNSNAPNYASDDSDDGSSDCSQSYNDNENSNGNILHNTADEQKISLTNNTNTETEYPDKTKSDNVTFGDNKENGDFLHDNISAKKLLNGVSLNIKEIWKEMNTLAPLDSVPKGIKKDVYYLVKRIVQPNGANIFVDDCGAWESSSRVNNTYLMDNNNNFTLIDREENGKFYKKVKKNGKVSGYTELRTDCSNSKVINISRYYSKKKGCSFERKISFTNEKINGHYVAIYEYKGELLTTEPHGNSKYKQAYVRTAPELLENVRQECGFKPPSQTYRDHQDMLRNRKQVYNVKQNKKKKINDPGSHFFKSNYADEVFETLHMLHDSDFVQKAVFIKGQAPAFVLQTKDQLEDIKQFCCTGNAVLGIDKTFNLGNTYLTLMVYKNLGIKDIHGNNPIFLGPMFLHHKSNQMAFSEFYNFLKYNLIAIGVKDFNRLIIGTDDETAMHKAFLDTFNCKHILCKKHLLDNLNEHLTNKIGVVRSLRKVIHKKVNNLLETESEESFEIEKQLFLQYILRVAPDAMNYISTTLLIRLKEKIWEHRDNIKVGWTNNNNESLNHAIKAFVDWKQNKLPELIRMLEKMVKGQVKDVKMSFVRMGGFELAKEFKQFEVDQLVWSSMTEDQRIEHYRKFKQFKPKVNSNISSSTNGKLHTVNAPFNSGKKKNQVKSKRAHKTTRKP